MWKELLPKIVGMKPIYTKNYPLPYSARVEIITATVNGFYIDISLRLLEKIFINKKGLELQLKFARSATTFHVENNVPIIGYNVLHGKGENLYFDDLSGWGK